MRDRDKLLDAVLAAAELMGHEVGERFAEGMVRELAGYPQAAAIAALKRCARECRGRLTLADVLARIDDGHLGVEQAWALAQQAKDEAATVVWTEEIAQAFGAAAPLLESGDAIGARMAFKEAYAVLLQQAREDKRPAKYVASLGHNPHARATAVMDAFDRGRIAAGYAVNLLPSGEQFDRQRDKLLALEAAANAPELSA